MEEVLVVTFASNVEVECLTLLRELLIEQSDNPNEAPKAVKIPIGPSEAYNRQF
jgi:hypothetical protein